VTLEFGPDCNPQTAQNHDEERLGSDDPTKAAFPFSYGLALAEAGQEVQIRFWGDNFRAW
jgi:hypothetical protein